MTDGRFEFLRRMLLVLTIFFALQGLTWPLLGSFDPLGLWDGAMETALYPNGLEDQQLEPFKHFILGPLGATNAGFWTLAAALVAVPFKRREGWAYRALIAAVLVWFLVDCTASLLSGATFNILIVNVPCLVLVGIPLLLMRPGFAKGLS